jgi:hypothetical protein
MKPSVRASQLLVELLLQVSPKAQDKLNLIVQFLKLGLMYERGALVTKKFSIVSQQADYVFGLVLR